MALLGGLVAGALLSSIATGLIGGGDVNNTTRLAYNQSVDAIAQVIQTAVQSTGQVATITQQIRVAPGATLSCGSGPVNIGNTAMANMKIIGDFTVKSAADISNAIAQKIQNDLTNDTTLTTSPFSWLPRNTTVSEIAQNMKAVVRSVYTSTNLNSMRQSLITNQTILLEGNLSGVGCNITNDFSMKMMAQNSMEVLSQALFANSFTQEAITNIRNKYTGTARGLFDFLGDIGRAIAIGIIMIVVVIVIIVIIGAVLRFRNPAPTTGGGTSLSSLLLLSSLAGSPSTSSTPSTNKAS